MLNERPGTQNENHESKIDVRNRGIHRISPEIERWREKTEFKVYEDAPIKIIDVVAKSPAEVSGLKIGDTITYVNGKVANSFTFIDTIQKEKGNPIILTVLDARGDTREVVLSPSYNEETKTWAVGVGMDLNTTNKFRLESQEDGFVRAGFCIELAPGKRVKGYLELGAIKELGSRRELLKYVFFFQRDGVEMEIDLVERYDREHSLCMIDPQLDSSGIFSPNSNTVTVKDIANRQIPHILIHEFRHATQHARKTDDDILNDLYKSALTDDYKIDDSNYIFWTLEVRKFSIKTIKELLMQSELAIDEDDATKIATQIKTRLSSCEMRTGQIHDIKFEMAHHAKKMEDFFLREIDRIPDSKEWELFFNLAHTTEKSDEEIDNILIKLDVSYGGNKCHDMTTENKNSAIEALRSLSTHSVAWIKEMAWKTNAITITIDDSKPKIILHFATDDELKMSLPIPEEMYHRLKTKLPPIKKLVEQSLAKTDELEDLRKQNDLELYSEIIDGLNVFDILRMPTLIKERDAEYAALAGLRDIKEETGLDLMPVLPEMTLSLSWGYEREGAIFQRVTIPKGTREVMMSIGDYMKLIGVNIPCVRDRRAKVRRAKRDKISV